MIICRNKKNICALIIIMIFSILLCGCQEKNDPESAVKKYFEALNSFDMEKMAKVIEVRQLTEFNTVIGTKFEEGTIEYITAEYIRSKTAELEYTVKEVDVGGGLAVVEVDCAYIDWEKAYKKIKSTMIDQVFMLILSGNQITDDNMNELLLELLFPENEEAKWSLTAGVLEFPEVEETFKVTLIQESGEWHVRNIKPKIVNSSWLGLKDFANEIAKAVSMMGLKTNNEPVKEKDIL